MFVNFRTIFLVRCVLAHMTIFWQIFLHTKDSYHNETWYAFCISIEAWANREVF